jgi:hypothetical protein
MLGPDEAALCLCGGEAYAEIDAGAGSASR